MEIPERMAKVESWQETHTDQCKERYQDIRGDTAEIKGTLLNMTLDLKQAVERIHARIDDTTKDLVQIDGRIDKQKIWNLSAVLTAAAAIIAWLAEHLFSVTPK